MAGERTPIAVVILTFNEEKNIDDCLDSIGDWAAEVFVVDSYSTDGTIDRLLARDDPRLYVVQNPFNTHSEQWNWALVNLPITTEWTLKLDADERVTVEFKEEASRKLRDAPLTLEGLWFRRREAFLGRRLGPVGTLRYDLRLWRSGRARFDNSALNEHAVVKGDTDRLRAAIDHVDNKSITEWLDKHNRYASIMATNYASGSYKSEIGASMFGNSDQRGKFLENIYRKLPFRYLFYFFYLYFGRLGIFDGRIGLHYCCLYAFYKYLIDLKMLECRLTGRAVKVVYPPRGQPDPRLTNYVTKS